MKKGVVFCLVVLLLSQAAAVWVISRLPEQRAAARWSDGTEYVQLSAFWNDDQAVQPGQLDAVRDALANGPEEERWTDAYSAQTVRAFQGTGGEVALAVCLIGGDFFSFHPLSLTEGRYPQAAEGTREILLDEDSAWALFGSAEAEGLEVSCGSEVYRVVGVAGREERLLAGDAAARLGEAETQEEGIVYLPFAALSAEEPPVECYEVLLPEPVEGYARDRFQRALAAVPAVHEVIQNTGRFSWAASLSGMGNLFAGGMLTGQAARPHWENLALAAEALLRLLRVVQLFCGGWILFCAFKKLRKTVASGKILWYTERVRSAGLAALRRKTERRR